MTNQIGFYNESAQGWERTLYAFLGEKQRRSGSRRTPESYSRMLQPFFGRLGKPRNQVTSYASRSTSAGVVARPAPGCT